MIGCKKKSVSEISVEAFTTLWQFTQAHSLIIQQYFLKNAMKTQDFIMYIHGIIRRIKEISVSKGQGSKATLALTDLKALRQHNLKNWQESTVRKHF